MQTSHALRAIFSALIAGAAAAPASAQEMTNELGASLRLGLQVVTEPDATINFENFGSRIGWNGGTSVNDLEVTAYLEFGFDQANGVPSTRQAWAGVTGEFGTMKGGKQYRAFYDLSAGFTDIAWWGSCFYQIACMRREAVIKYEKPLGGGTRLVASGTMQNGDADDDLFDELETGAVFEFGDYKLGAVAGFSASEGEAGPGMAFGVAFSTTFGNVAFSSSMQYAEQDYLNSTSIRESGDPLSVRPFVDDGLFLNAAASVDRWYAVAGLRDANDTPFFATLGYEYPIVDDALLYAEVELSDPGKVGVDTNLTLRTVFIYNFGSVSLQNASTGEL